MQFSTKRKLLKAITWCIWAFAVIAFVARCINQPSFQYADVLDQKLPKVGVVGGSETH